MIDDGDRFESEADLTELLHWLWPIYYVIIAPCMTTRDPYAPEDFM
jgi:hypothetical protein